MFLQIAYRADSELLRTIAPHHQRVSVVEAKWLSHTNANFAQCVFDLLNSELLIGFQDFLCDRTGVFGIDVDLSSPQCFPKNDRPAHSLSMFCWNAAVGQFSLCNFAEHIRLGKFLRADDDRISRRDRGESQEKSKDGSRSPSAMVNIARLCRDRFNIELGALDPASCFHVSASVLCALMNSETKLLAGFSRRSTIDPCWTMRPSFMSTISSPR